MIVSFGDFNGRLVVVMSTSFGLNIRVSLSISHNGGNIRTSCTTTKDGEK